MANTTHRIPSPTVAATAVATLPIWYKGGPALCHVAVARTLDGRTAVALMVDTGGR